MTPSSRPALDWEAATGLVRRLAKVGDPLADAAVERLDRHVDDAATLYGTLAHELSAANDPRHEWIDAHFRERPLLPDWIDHDLVRRGQDLYRAQPWSLNVAFMLASLPMSYCGALGAEVLEWTGFLERDPQRRVYETSLLVMEIAEEEGLHDGRDGTEPGHGYLTLLRVRLLHAATRRALVHYGVELPDGPRTWDVELKGEPVCQLDLLATLWSFALTSVSSLERVHPEIAEADLRGWVHLWCVVGHLLGVADDELVGPLLPMGPDEARQCFAAVQAERFGASDAGRQLTRGLVSLGRRQIPGRSKDDLVEAMIRANIGDENAGRLELPLTDDAGLLAKADRMWRKATRPPAVSRLVPKAGRWWMKRFVLRAVASHLAHPHSEPFRTPKATNDLLRSYHSMVVLRMAWYRRFSRRVPFRR